MLPKHVTHLIEQPIGGDMKLFLLYGSGKVVVDDECAFDESVIDDDDCSEAVAVSLVCAFSFIVSKTLIWNQIKYMPNCKNNN